MISLKKGETIKFGGGLVAEGVQQQLGSCCIMKFSKNKFIPRFSICPICKIRYKHALFSKY